MAFERLFHADWSTRAQGRWAAWARRAGGAWSVDAPAPVALAQVCDELVASGAAAPTLAGFDFPIGLPVAYARKTGFDDFRDALDRLGPGFYAVAERPDEIGVTRPFYPARPGGTRRRHLLDGHGVPDIADLTRRCERGGAGLRAAGCMFWTLGAAQVGKGALHGWRHVIRPLRARGARLWPFEGDLDTLAGAGGLTLAETYPADGYARLGFAFGRGESKRRQGDRAAKAPAIARWAARRSVRLPAPLVDALRDGLGAEEKSGDSFDALIGLLAMIDVLAADTPADAPRDDDVRRWEGWILGRPAGP